MGNRACLAVNDVGKPCAGDPHARFERGPLEKRDNGRDERETARPALGTNRQPTTQRPTSQLSVIDDRSPIAFWRWARIGTVMPRAP